MWSWSRRPSPTRSPTSSSATSPPGARSRSWRGAAAATMTTMASEAQPPGGAPRIEHGDEAALVARARAGDRAAFGVLVERYAAPARRVARAVLDDPDDADDAAQDALLAALVKLHQYDPRS